MAEQGRQPLPDPVLYCYSHKPIPCDMRFPLSVCRMRECAMSSLVCAPLSPTPAGSCPLLLGWFTGATAQSEFSGTCESGAKLMAFGNWPPSIDESKLEISLFFCILLPCVLAYGLPIGSLRMDCLRRHLASNLDPLLIAGFHSHECPDTLCRFGLHMLQQLRIYVERKIAGCMT